MSVVRTVSSLDLAQLVNAIVEDQPCPLEWTACEDDANALARAWHSCADGRAMMRTYVLAESDLRPVVRAALGCARAASSYEATRTSPWFVLDEAFDAVDRWLEDPESVALNRLTSYAEIARSWSKVACSSSAYAIVDVLQLTDGIANGTMRWVPRLAGAVLEDAADALVEDLLRAEGSVDCDSVSARLTEPARALLTQLVRELLPCPTTTARAMRDRMKALRAA